MSTETEEVRPGAEFEHSNHGVAWASDEAAAAQEELANEPRSSSAEDGTEPADDWAGDTGTDAPELADDGATDDLVARDWAGIGGGVTSEELLPAPDQSPNQYPVHSGSLSPVEAAAPDAAQPLLAAQVQSELLEQWTGIQVSFVEDPRAAVQDAEALVAVIAAKFQRALQERRGALASGWSDSADTEELRLALQQYRAFVGVLLPR